MWLLLLWCISAAKHATIDILCCQLQRKAERMERMKRNAMKRVGMRRKTEWHETKWYEMNETQKWANNSCYLPPRRTPSTPLPPDPFAILVYCHSLCCKECGLAGQERQGGESRVRRSSKEAWSWRSQSRSRSSGRASLGSRPYLLRLQFQLHYPFIILLALTFPF